MTATCAEHPRHKAGCEGCKTRAAAKERSRAIAYGTWRGLQDPEPVRERVLHLQNRYGMSATRIANKAGVARSVVHRLVAGVAIYLQPRIYDALLAVQPDVTVISDTDLVPSIGVARRLQALAARGHGLAKLGAELGARPKEVSRWRRGYRPSIVAGTDRIVRDVYRRLADIEGDDDQTIALAHAERWAPPAAWDSDEAMDDPCARPDMSVVRDPICEVLEGRRTADSLSPDDRLRAVEYLIALNCTDRQIHARLRWTTSVEAVAAYRKRHGLAPGGYRGQSKDAAKRARERRREAFLQLTQAEKTAAIDRFDFNSEPVTKIAQAVGCPVSTIESRRTARSSARDHEPDPVMTRRAVDGHVRFGALNRAEKLLLFSTYGQAMTQTDLMRVLHISAGTYREWMVQVSAGRQAAA